MSFNLGFSESKSIDDGDKNSKKNHKKRNSDQTLPMLSTLRSHSPTTAGLTPINSFSGDNNGRLLHGGDSGAMGAIVPMSSIDGMALRAFFSSSPNTTGGVVKPGVPVQFHVP